MKTSSLPQRPVATRPDRRIAGRVQVNPVQDPYLGKKKLPHGTLCPQCTAVYRDARWQWGASEEGAPRQLCPACRRANERFPAGIISLHGDFAKRHRGELVQLARHHEEAEKSEHALNRIIDITDEADGLEITTTDIHLPRRIGEAVERAFHGELAMHFEEDGYFVRVNWTPPE